MLLIDGLIFYKDEEHVEEMAAMSQEDFNLLKGCGGARKERSWGCGYCIKQHPEHLEDLDAWWEENMERINDQARARQSGGKAKEYQRLPRGRPVPPKAPAAPSSHVVDDSEGDMAPSRSHEKSRREEKERDRGEKERDRRRDDKRRGSRSHRREKERDRREEKEKSRGRQREKQKSRRKDSSSDDSRRRRRRPEHRSWHAAGWREPWDNDAGSWQWQGRNPDWDPHRAMASASSSWQFQCPPPPQLQPSLVPRPPAWPPNLSLPPAPPLAPDAANDSSQAVGIVVRQGNSFVIKPMSQANQLALTY